MAIRKYKPTTPARRHMTVSKFEGIDKKAKPERSLTEVLKKSSGRNNTGRITVRHQGGGNKRKYRIIDFKRDKEGFATVLRLEYDPNRSANIALVEYEDGERRYILAPVGLNAGDKVESGAGADITEMRQFQIQKRKQRIKEMLLIHFRFRRDRCQIHFLIPLCQFLDIPVKLRHLRSIRLLPVIPQDLHERLFCKCPHTIPPVALL